MNIYRLLLTAVIALAVGTSIVTAQGPRKDIGTNVPLPEGDDGDIQATISIDVDLVTVDVVVTDNDNNPITGLEKHHFTVFDEDAEQVITNFSPTEAPMTVVIVAEFGETFGYYFDDVVGPAAGFINSLRPADWAALVAFDIRPEILTDFTRNKAELFDGLNRMRIPGFRETALYDAVYDTLERLEDIDGKKAIFLLSTGIDTFSKRNWGETLKRAEASDTMIYAISMGQLARLHYEPGFAPEVNIGLLQADNVMRSLADRTGGLSFFPRFAGQYGSIYETVSAHMRNQYSIGFVPQGRETDGKLRELRVEVPELDVNGDGKPDKLKVRHKKGYYAPEI